jgi:hypothetical protein
LLFYLVVTKYVIYLYSDNNNEVIITKKINIMKILITSENTFNTVLNSVDVNNVKNVTDKSFYANVQFEWEDGTVTETDGEFGYEDYKEDCGFIFSK